ncbi:MAG TPA: transcription-repair coupling factor [Gammaproteobacteria bacterium]|nr:transcription-repair coupling factor [Gammaproteobacteria bacterium]
MDSSHAFAALPLPDARAPHVRWGRLPGAALGLAAAEAAERHKGPVVIVAPSAAAADRLERELAFFSPGAPTHRFPDYETLPYEPISPPQDLLAERLSAMHELARRERRIFIVDAEALMSRLPPPDFILSRSLDLRVGQEVDRDTMTERLVSHGYMRVEQVAEPGEFAVRGALLDVYPTGAAAPVRIDFFDEEIETLRTFDPQTQMSRGETNEAKILPAREFPFDSQGITGFRRRFRARFPGEPSRCPIYRDISEAQLPAGVEYYLPLFFDETKTLLDYVPPDALIIMLEDARQGLEEGWRLVEERYEQLRGDIERPILPPDAAFVPPAEVLAALDARPTLHLLRSRVEQAPAEGTGGAAADATGGAPANATSEAPADEAPETAKARAGEKSRDFDSPAVHPLSSGLAPEADRIARWLDGAPGERTLLVTSSPGHREMLLELLRGRGYAVSSLAGWREFVASDAALGLAIGELDEGLALPDRHLRIVTAEQIGMERPRQRTRRRRAARDPDAVIRELTDLRVGAPVVHEDYGVGRYQGLKTLEVEGVETEFLVLEYAGGDKLYVPVQSLHLVTRYSGASPENAPLHRLGTDQWSKARAKAAQQARDVAAELLNLYARRAAREGLEYKLDDQAYQHFAMQFPFEETEDQATAILDVLKDLASTKPMDRIVCGDVGFGKTEVALRSAFAAVESGYQVAVLVPTTLLAQQHYRTFADRFADWPVRVEQLSRFRSAKDAKGVLADLAAGKVDVVIGTHRLLQSDVRFKRLGLVIVDEEHRFGVKHKEQLKKLRAEVDVLTMTATPIPRTLNMTLGGLRDLSIIATPPAERLAVKTFVGEWHDRQIRDAVLRELRRGGQVYFVHNRVENIEGVAEQLRKLLPEASIRIAHGQMSEHALEEVMLDFYHRRFNVLLCTTIIESGIDIPTANTIIITRADKLGLAQLHQLRGRVGRSHHQAYAYLIAPPARSLTPDAAKRLEAIETLEDLGSGFALATHDLEIRGAGELLGEGQSGQIHAVGFTLYNELLSRAVAELKEGREPDLEDPFSHGPEVELGLPALIPEDYMPDVHTRLVHYKRIANASSREELDRLQVELIDRFGLLPPQAKTLFQITWLKLLAQRLGVRKVQAGASGGSITFADRAKVDPAALVGLVGDEPETYRLDGPYKLRFSWGHAHDEQRVGAVEKLLLRLGAGELEAAA